MQPLPPSARCQSLRLDDQEAGQEHPASVAIGSDWPLGRDHWRCRLDGFANGAHGIPRAPCYPKPGLLMILDRESDAETTQCKDPAVQLS